MECGRDAIKPLRAEVAKRSTARDDSTHIEYTGYTLELNCAAFVIAFQGPCAWPWWWRCIAGHEELKGLRDDL